MLERSLSITIVIDSTKHEKYDQKNQKKKNETFILMLLQISLQGK